MYSVLPIPAQQCLATCSSNLRGTSLLLFMHILATKLHPLELQPIRTAFPSKPFDDYILGFNPSDISRFRCLEKVRSSQIENKLRLGISHFNIEEFLPYMSALFTGSRTVHAVVRGKRLSINLVESHFAVEELQHALRRALQESQPSNRLARGSSSYLNV